MVGTGWLLAQWTKKDINKSVFWPLRWLLVLLNHLYSMTYFFLLHAHLVLAFDLKSAGPQPSFSSHFPTLFAVIRSWQCVSNLWLIGQPPVYGPSILEADVQLSWTYKRKSLESRFNLFLKRKKNFFGYTFLPKVYDQFFFSFLTTSVLFLKVMKKKCHLLFQFTKNG